MGRSVGSFEVQGRLWLWVWGWMYEVRTGCSMLMVGIEWKGGRMGGWMDGWISSDLDGTVGGRAWTLVGCDGGLFGSGGCWSAEGVGLGGGGGGGDLWVCSLFGMGLGGLGVGRWNLELGMLGWVGWGWEVGDGRWEMGDG